MTAYRTPVLAQSRIRENVSAVGHAVDDQVEMLDTARRIDDDEVVFVRSPDFLEPRYEPPQASAMHFFRDRTMIGQLQFLHVLSIPFMSILEVPGEG